MLSSELRQAPRRSSSRRLSFSATAAQASPRVTEIPLRAQYAVPNEIVAGPDGAIYTSDSSLGKVWRIGDNGRVRVASTSAAAPPASPRAHGALWVSNRDTSAIVRLGLDGAQTSYPVTPGRVPERHRARLRRRPVVHRVARQRDRPARRVDGTVTEYPLPDAGRVRRRHHARPGRRAVVHRVQRQQGRAHHHRRRDHRVHAADRRQPARPDRRRRRTARSGSPSATPTRSAA